MSGAHDIFKYKNIATIRLVRKSWMASGADALNHAGLSFIVLEWIMAPNINSDGITPVHQKNIFQKKVKNFNFLFSKNAKTQES